VKTKFISKYGKPITGAATQMKPGPQRPAGPDGSSQNAMAQIKLSPRPFGNPNVNPISTAPESNQQFRAKQVQGSPAPGVRPRAHTAASPRSEPMAHSSRMKAVGYSPDYAASYNPSTHPRARVRVMRGAVPGAKPLVKPMDSGDFAEGAALYRKEHGRL
jgi:hypothetical protein